MPIVPAELVHAHLSIDREEVQRRLLAGETLLRDTPDHLLEVVGVLESYGEVLDAYSINLIYQAEEQFLNPVPIFKYLDGDLSPAKIWLGLTVAPAGTLNQRDNPTHSKSAPFGEKP